MTSILFIGESWFTHSIHQKGFDSFVTTEYVEGASQFIARMESRGHEVRYIPSHKIEYEMPSTAVEIDRYDVVVLSDVGANTFLISRATFTRSERTTNLLSVLVDYVDRGGGLVMIGGYMSFAGIDGKARFGSSSLASVLPVVVQDHDDRVEVPEGVAPVVCAEHSIVQGLETPWPSLLGYNRTVPKPDAAVLATCTDDPLLVVGEHGGGRSVAFTSDLAPHWAPPEFVDWDGYSPLWSNIMDWAAGKL